VDLNYQANVGTNSIVASTVSVPYGFGGSGNGVTTTPIDFEADAMKGISFEDYKTPVIFKDKMPEMEKINEMCDMYPTLDIAFQKFKNIYNIVIDDFDNKMQLKMPF
jgi:hypothetical protein